MDNSTSAEGNKNKIMHTSGKLVKLIVKLCTVKKSTAYT